MNLLSKLPAYRGDVKPIVDNQTFGDIKTEVCRAHYIYAPDYDKIASDFWKGNIERTAQGLFQFAKRYFTYVEESENNQTTRSPSAVLSTANSWGVDCKHYAGFIAGVLDALKRQGKKIDWYYRFVSYDLRDSTPSHVFVVVNDNGREIFIDPVFESLDNRNPSYFYKLDKNCSMLSRVSGSGVGVTHPVMSIKDNLVFELPDLRVSPTLPDDRLTFTQHVVNREASTWLWVLAGAAVLYFVTKNKKRR